MDTAYECLQRSEAPGFTQENFDTEYWFQKGYIIQFADSMATNPTPTFVGANLKEMQLFWTDMMAFYDIPLVAPIASDKVWVRLQQQIQIKFLTLNQNTF